MRISDWSSDVCSSDLAPHVDAGIDRAALGRIELLAPHRLDAVAADQDVATQRRHALAGAGIGQMQGDAGVVLLGLQQPAAEMAAVGAEAPLHRAAPESGRASGRERVWRYV